MDAKKRKKIWEQVVDQIKSLIISGKWEIGRQLPAEIELAKEFGVSRPTLREAIKHLSLLGLIEVRHGQGSFVTTPNNESFMRPLASMLIQEKQSTLEIVEARIMIETTTAFLAAKRITEDDILILKNNLLKMEQCKNNIDEYVEIDHLFHKQIALAAKNIIIIKMFEAVEDLLVTQQFRKVISPNMKTGIEEHYKIFEALIAADSEKAQFAMNEHLKATLFRRYLTMIEK